MTCPSPEVVAAMAEGRLSETDRDAFLDHAAGCDDCRHAALILSAPKFAAAKVAPRAATRSWIPWAAAAAILLSILGLLLLATEPAQETKTVRTAPKKVEAEDPKPTAPVEVPKPIPPKPQEPAPEPLKPPTPKPAEPAPEPPAKPTHENPAPEPVKPAPTPEPAKPVTEVTIAAIQRLEGEVFVVTGASRTPAKAGQDLRNGDGLECRGALSWAIVSYPDRTRVEVEGNTVVRELLGRQPGKGLRVVVEKGAVKAEVAKQPAGQPMLFLSAHGQAQVLGTTLRIVVEGDPKKGMRLEVEEGKVELANLAGRTVLVESGHSAIAATGTMPAIRRLSKDEVLLSLDLEDGKKPSVISKGTVERGPDRRLCIAGEADGSASRLFFVDEGDGLFVATGEEVLSFDYWVDPQAASVNLSLWNRTQRVSHEGGVPKLVTGKWTRASLRLTDVSEQGFRLKEGDIASGMLLQATGGAKKFYVDNLTITRPRTIRIRPSEAK